MAFSMAMPFHKGEEQMHKLLKVPSYDNPTSAMLTPQASFSLQRSPLLALGTLDSQNRPWTTLWGGHAGFSQPLGGGLIGTRTIVDGAHDPVVQALVGNVEKGEMVQQEKILSGLSIDLMKRTRVKLSGRMVAGAVGKMDVEFEDEGERPDEAPEKQDQIQLVMKIEQSLGNCPKYLNQYEVQPAFVTSELVSQGPTLTPDAKALISKSDMFFLSSSTEDDMDTNHRGGPAGFVRVLSDTEIVYPEYSGNRLYQSLGNLQLNPKIGITFPDYETGAVLYTTGAAEILIAGDAAKLLPGSNLALKMKLDEVRLIEGGLPFRGKRKLPSPYNPLVRTLASEGNIKSSIAATRTTARLVKKTLLTPSVARFTFSVPDGIAYTPGQWVAFDFSGELDIGYSHMRDDDPRSLNDDFVRTFTISSRPTENGTKEKEFEITIRNVGVITSFLFKQNDRAGFEVPIVGVGGEFKIEQRANDAQVTSFVAGGVGITPLLGQLEGLDTSPGRFKLFWTTRPADANLALETLQRHTGLAKSTEIFFTGLNASKEIEEKIEEIEKMGAKVERRRRIGKNDLNALNADTWYLCAGKPLRKEVLTWLEGKRVIFENFDY
ncbi:hypothetical protein BU26DRAFT_524404 [Trematosphaeria pertusa]|uniref:FAD-binding FR-type domain-containing protein n=1 Tax=Trematosphaeria pertusa TaxID=390896 RepID=A0A6A6HVU2_9PLEO|nr:uncharacterized protein BU26DRAFT_524404 [Trematosphaeria pertusa]KAF2242216.1 hypothetical protein BU26DRAFT_524404 [Trematosphaeria pertusa]